MFRFKKLITCCAPLLLIGLNGCSNTGILPEATTRPSLTTNVNDYQYLIGPGDSLTIFVWRNPEVSGNFIVRPDCKVTTSLVEDIDVAGRTIKLPETSGFLQTKIVRESPGPIKYW